MKFSVALVAVSGLLASAAPAISERQAPPPPPPASPFNSTFAIRVLAHQPGAWFHNRPLDVAGDIGGGINILQPSMNPAFPENQFTMEQNMDLAPSANPNMGFLRYKGFDGTLRLYAGFDRRQHGLKIFELVNSPGNPNPTKFHGDIHWDNGFMKINGRESFFMCNVRKTDGTVVGAINWDNTGTAAWQGCWQVSLIMA